LITRLLQRMLIQAKEQLEVYADCLDVFFGDVAGLESLDLALDVAEALQRDAPLEIPKKRKKRDQAETEDKWDEDLP
jgi:hypothetical protein